MNTDKKGFTMAELLVAMVILVIVFGLVTYLYTRAAKIRKIVVINSEIQQVLSQMMDTLIHGEKGTWGLIDGIEIDSASNDATLIVSNATEQMTATIDDNNNPDTITVNTMVLDVERKVIIKKVANETPTLPGSKFEYFNHQGQPVDPSTSAPEISFVKITLWACSTDPSFSQGPAVPLITGVRLRNKISF